jgi:hypothetical protein
VKPTTPPHALAVQCLLKHRDSFALAPTSVGRREGGRTGLQLLDARSSQAVRPHVGLGAVLPRTSSVTPAEYVRTRTLRPSSRTSRNCKHWAMQQASGRSVRLFPTAFDSRFPMVTGFSSWPNAFSRTMALGSTATKRVPGAACFLFSCTL